MAFYLPELARVQEELRARRVKAFLDPGFSVCGLDLRPLTLRTWSLLECAGNAFVTGEPVTPADVRNFLWVHTAAFARDPYDTAARLRFTRRLTRRLRLRVSPLRHAAAIWSAVRGFRWLARFTAHDWSRLDAAITAIHETIKTTWADLLTGGSGDIFAAQSTCSSFIAFFQHHAGMTPEQVLDTPLIQLVILHRDILAQLTGKVTPTAAEDEVLFAFQDSLNTPVGGKN